MHKYSLIGLFPISGVLLALITCLTSFASARQTDACDQFRSVYTVQAGDMLVGIGEKFGSTLFWEAIYIANADLIDDPDLIYAGQQFEIPMPVATFEDSGRQIFEVLDDPFCETAELPVHAIDSTRIYLYDIEQLRYRSQDNSKFVKTKETVSGKIEAFRKAFDSVVKNKKNETEEQTELTAQQE